MKDKYIKKLRKYTESDDIGKLKHYVKKHKLDIVNVLLDDHNTLLHLASSKGAECVIRLCIKSGCDPLLVNKDGQLPIHLACRYAAKHQENNAVYTDVILPLIKSCPSSLDVADKRGNTAREMLGDVKARMKDVLDTDSEQDDEGPRGSRSPSPDWHERLAEAMEDDCQQDWGRYDPKEADYQEEKKTENYDEWVTNTMYQRRKRYYQQQGIRRESNPPPDSKRAKPSISDEAKKRFEENLKKQAEIEQRILREERLKATLRMKQIYEEHCESVFGSKERRKLSYRAIPWPHEPGGKVDTMERFLFGEMMKGSNEYRKYLRSQQVRWHPDRFVQKVGDRIKDDDRTKVLDKVKQISQLLNALTES